MKTPFSAPTIMVILALIGGVPHAVAQEASGASPAGDWDMGQIDEKAVRAYLSALDSVKLNIEAEVAGSILARRGTTLQIAVEFDTAGLNAEDRAKGPVITKLMVGPKDGKNFGLGPLQLKGLSLREDGAVCLRLDVTLIKDFKEKLCITKIVKEDDGTLDFHSDRDGWLTGKVPEMRISSDGEVQKFKRKGFWFIKWDGEWQTVGEKKMPMPLPVHEWPIHLSDLLDWLPIIQLKSGTEPTTTAEQKELPSLPTTQLSISFASQMKQGRVPLSGVAGNLSFSNHTIDLKINGTFEDGAFRTDADQENSLDARWTIAGALDDASLGRLDINKIQIDLGGRLDAMFPFADLKQRSASVAFDAGIDLVLSKLNLRTEEGIAIAMPEGLSGQVTGRGSAHLLPRQTKLKVALSPGSGLKLEIPGSIVLDRPVDSGGPPDVLNLPGKLNLAAAPGKPLLSVAGSVATSSRVDAVAGSSRNLILVDAGFELAAIGKDEFGLNTGTGLWATFAPGTGIGLRGRLNAEAGLQGLERIVGAALAVDLRLLEGDGDFGLRTADGLEFGGRIRSGGRIAIDTGTIASVGESLIGTQGKGSSIEGDLHLGLGKGEAASIVTGEANLNLRGEFTMRLDPAQRKAEPRGSLVVGPVGTVLSLGIELEAGSEVRPPDSSVPILFKTPLRLDLGVKGGFGPAADPDKLGTLEVTFGRPVDVKVEFKQK